MENEKSWYFKGVISGFSIPVFMALLAIALPIYNISINIPILIASAISIILLIILSMKLRAKKMFSSGILLGIFLYIITLIILKYFAESTICARMI